MVWLICFPGYMDWEYRNFGLRANVKKGLLYKVYRITGNFRLGKIARKCVLNLQKKFSRYKCVTIWPHPYRLMAGHAQYAKRKNDTERQREEASSCNNGLVFLLCGGLRNYESIRNANMGEKLACWTEGRLRQLLSVSYGFLGNSYSSRLILLYSDNLEGKQTLENHPVYTGTSLYRRTHIFRGFYILRKHFCPQKSQKFAPSENFLLYVILSLVKRKSGEKRGRPVNTYITWMTPGGHKADVGGGGLGLGGAQIQMFVKYTVEWLSYNWSRVL